MQEQLLHLWVLGPEASAAFTDCPCAQDVWMLVLTQAKLPLYKKYSTW